MKFYVSYISQKNYIKIEIKYNKNYIKIEIKYNIR